ncbi:MAG: hypothetical protein V2I36_04375 [Desulfopila sp.]|jgi:hypothetical protein|nr:hypothetical protein [Desulfopila sp.]
MNIFFYAGSADSQEQQFARKLLQRPCFADMVILPGGGELISPLSLELRGGDLLILCAASNRSITNLLSIHEKFVDFRIIVILSRNEESLIQKSLALRPRYITTMLSNLDELDGVVEKMMLSRRNDARGCVEKT